MRLLVLLAAMALPGCADLRMLMSTEFHPDEKHCTYNRVGSAYDLECSEKGTVVIRDGQEQTFE